MNLQAPNQSQEAPFGDDHPEYQRRMEAFEEAWHNNRLEGIKNDDFGRYTAMMYARGEITRDELREIYATVTLEEVQSFNASSE